MLRSILLLLAFPVLRCSLAKMAEMKEMKALTYGVITTILLSSAVFALVEDLDDTFKDNRMDDVWLVDFYAPWCGYCKKLEPIWYEVGAELKNSGSPVRVGKMDATAYSGMASEFGVRGYPTIKLLKGELAYNYKGPRTKDDIIEFANRVAGPSVRSLPSRQMFEHVLKRHNVLFVYIGGESLLKEKYIDVASELIVYTYFFSASEDIIPEQYVTLSELPCVVVFKDGTYFTYDEYEDGSLASWVNRERFQGYLQIDGFTLYELGETELPLVDTLPWQHIEWHLDELLCARLKSLIQRVSTEYRDNFYRDFQFGHMDGNDYINSLIMGEVAVPSVIVLNTSNEQYFLPSEPMESLEQLISFIRSVLDGTAQAYGGDGFFHRLKRVAYDARSTIMADFGFNEHHQNEVINYMRFARSKRLLRLKTIDSCFQELKDSRLVEETFTVDEVSDMLDGLQVVVRGEVEMELINTAHTNVLLLRQLFSQAEKFYLKLQTDISELESRELLEQVAAFEKTDFKSNSKVNQESSKPKLAPLNEGGVSELLNKEISRLQEENDKLRARLRTLESKAMNALDEKCEAERALNDLQKIQGDQQHAMHAQEISKLEDTVAAMQIDFEKTLSASTASQKELQDSLVSAKHELLRVQDHLALAEKIRV
ncbi:leucine zipper transcription factor-like protein 1 isoform X6 [Pangasianodon hypophthalmus]|uniref:leucine zipper transcription factor-like protein 1 isoform X6 n=1 Tax=Pangasianodon hypophthalmus TaxID=310915 RepID=UPI00230774EA|nr:leucine zipper transcription factor-like protein 1 isoform X6 [Pangasianodon hypophthalmus]